MRDGMTDTYHLGITLGRLNRHTAGTTAHLQLKQIVA